MTEQTTLKINGMSCAGCAGNVEKTLKRISGVVKATVNLKAGSAQVEFDAEKVTRQDLVKAVKNTGYGAG
ncbi:MAG TPA: heavy metal-associated domain-containing protein [Dehalococcoidales bacterium]|nr:heavy metal-associated domain-containing protein [Dehalococcoidales bacterium]